MSLAEAIGKILQYFGDDKSIFLSTGLSEIYVNTSDNVIEVHFTDANTESVYIPF